MYIKLMAEVYRLGISVDFLTVQEMIKWADNIIENLDKPPYEIIEFSLSSKEKHDDINLKLIDSTLPPKILLALLNEYLNTTQDISKVIIVLDKLIKHF
jgi:hypothetical protein